MTTTRRDFLRTSGMLVVSVSALPLDVLATAEAVARGQGATGRQGAGPYPDPDFRQLDSWIVIVLAASFTAACTR